MNNYEIFLVIGTIASIVYVLWSNKKGIKHTFI